MELKNFNFRQKLIYHPEHLIALQSRERPFPITCELDLTNLCNHDCYFCVAKEARETYRTSLETSAALNAIAQMWELGVKGISFTGGGEPLVHKDFYAILKKTHETGFHTGLMTNGVLLRKDGEYLRNLNWIRISVGAGSRELYHKIHGHDDFDRVVENIYMLVQRQRELHTAVDIGVRTFLDFDNYRTLPQLAKTLQNSGINYIQVAPDSRDTSYPVWKSESVQSVIAETEAILADGSIRLLKAGFIQNQGSLGYPQKCYAHFYHIALAATGDVMFCEHIRGRPEMSIGNIYRSTLKEMWDGEVCKALEGTIAPKSCPEICKSMQINEGIEAFLYPTNDMSINFYG